MRFPEYFIDEIKRRVPISRVVGMKVTWDAKKSNPAKGDYWACCPFHEEKTPSFHVQDKKGNYYCFGCHAKGNIVTFLMETENLRFGQAVEKLAELAHLQIPKNNPQEEEKYRQAKKRKETLHNALEYATQFFERNIREKKNIHARRYLEERDIAEETQHYFRLGYAPATPKRALIEALTQKGIPLDIMKEAGLIMHGDDIPVPYDRFRNRLIFPISHHGQIIAFGARALNEGATAKYINSPQTPLFNKSQVLYHFENAKKEAMETKNLIVVEGYMDVIALQKNGFQAVTAPLGTAVTQAHLEAMWKAAPEPIFCFDGDAAGHRAAQRVASNALPLLEPGYSIRFALLPQGKDPDDVIRSEGAHTMRHYIENATTLSQMIWSLAFNDIDLSIPERAAAAENTLWTYIHKIKNDTIRHYYTRNAREKLKIMPNSGEKYPKIYNPAHTGGKNIRKWQNKKNPTRKPWTQKPIWEIEMPPGNRVKNSLNALKIGERRAQLMIFMIFNHPQLIRDYSEEMSEITFHIPDLDAIKEKMINLMAKNQKLDTESLRYHLNKRELNETIEPIEKMARNCGYAYLQYKQQKENKEKNQKQEKNQEHIRKIWNQLYMQYFKTTKLNRELKYAEKQFTKEPSIENLHRINAIREQIDKTDRANDAQEN